MKPLLSLDQVDVGYGQLPVARGLDLVVNEGEIVAILGPNGVGKTTTVLTIAGELPPLSGTVSWCGKKLTGPLHARVRNGLGLVTEEKSIIKRLSLSDNIRLGRVEVEAVLAIFPELSSRLRINAGSISGGEQQMLAVGCALARKPRLLLADELSSGLAPIVTDRLFRALRHAADQGTAVLLVEQYAHRALDLADRAYVMRKGEIFFHGEASEVKKSWDELSRAYLSVS